MKKVKRVLTEVLEIPEEIMLNLPLITVTGREKIIIENYKGIIEYDENIIRINTGAGIVKVEGEKLFLKNITSESITITGVIKNLEYMV